MFKDLRKTTLCLALITLHVFELHQQISEVQRGANINITKVGVLSFNRDMHINVYTAHVHLQQISSKRTKINPNYVFEKK